MASGLPGYDGVERLAERLFGGREPPRVGVVRQLVEAPVEADPETAAEREAARVLAALGRKPGPVAVGVGSRGIANLQAVVRGTLRALRAAGWEPFIVPAMGSHGAATAAGQARVLAGYGITEAELGVPVRATMETRVVGEIEGLPYHVDRYAVEAGALFLVCRIKPHTDFHGDWESGPAKMCGIGLGKQVGARTMHSAGVRGLRELAPAAARLAAVQGLLLGAVAVVENQRDETALVAGLGPGDVAGARETELLRRAAALMPRLPFEQLDVLVVERMGKDVSGTGLDSNVLNRMRIPGEPEPAGLRIASVAVLDLTDRSHGNGIGMGLADFVTRRFYEKLDLEAVYANTLTAGLVGHQRAMLPTVMPTDRLCVAAAVSGCGRPAGEPVRLAWIADTLHTEVIGVSEVVWEEVAGRPEIDRVSNPLPMPFRPDGSLVTLLEGKGPNSGANSVSNAPKVAGVGSSARRGRP